MIKTFLTSGFIVASTLTLTNSAFAEISGQLAVGYEIGSYEVVTDIDIEADISMLTLSGSLFLKTASIQNYHTAHQKKTNGALMASQSLWALM